MENRSFPKQLQAQGKALQRLRSKSSTSFGIDKIILHVSTLLGLPYHHHKVTWLKSSSEERSNCFRAYNLVSSWCNFRKGQPSLLRICTLRDLRLEGISESLLFRTRGTLHVSSWLQLSQNNLVCLDGLEDVL